MARTENSMLLVCLLTLFAFSASAAPSDGDEAAAALRTAPRPMLRKVVPASGSVGDVVWEETFGGGDPQPDPRKWTFDLGASGWGNRELQEYTDSVENVRVESGNLVIQARQRTAGGRITSGRIHSQDKVTFQYGSLEARMKIPDLANGLWPAFWTLGNNFPVVGWPFCGELDIMEAGYKTGVKGGFVNKLTISAAHWSGEGEKRSYAVDSLMPPGETLDDGEFHLFRMDWSKNQVETFVDNRRVFAFDITPDGCPGCEEFHQPHYVLLNMAVGGVFPNLYTVDEITAVSPTKSPEYVVDYIRLRKNKDTLLGGSFLTGPLVEDCGCGSVCDDAALDMPAGSSTSTCRSVINDMMAAMDVPLQQEACRMAADAHPDTCALNCNPATCQPSEFVEVIDCGKPDTCTPDILNELVTGAEGTYSRIARIRYLISSEGFTQEEACVEIATVFPAASAAGCDPGSSGGQGRTDGETHSTGVTCGCAAACTSAVLSTVTPGFDGNGQAISPTFAARVEYLSSPDRGSEQKSENDACQFVVDEFSNIPALAGCDPRIECPQDNTDADLDCGCAQTCTSAVLNTITPGFDGSGQAISPTFAARVEYLSSPDRGSEQKSETQACQFVVNEFPNIPALSGCDPRLECPENDSSDGNFDCGCAQTCTSAVLNTITPGFDGSGQAISPTFAARVGYLSSPDRGQGQKSENDACQFVVDEFPEIPALSGCDPRIACGGPVESTPSDGSVICGCQNTCTNEILDTVTETYDGDGKKITPTIFERIVYLKNEQSKSETEACQIVVGEVISAVPQAAGCNPAAPCPPTTPSDGSVDCGCPNSCTNAILDTPSLGVGSGGKPISPSLFERIMFVHDPNMPDYRVACQTVADEFPGIAFSCNPSVCQPVSYPSQPAIESIDCGCPASCSQSDLAIKTPSPGGEHSCGARISWVMFNLNMSEKAACAFVYDESLTSGGASCDSGCDPRIC